MKLRTMVRGLYDIQHLRIGMGNRIAANFREKLGVKSGEKVEGNEDATKILKQLKADYKRVTDGIATKKGIPTPAKFKGNGIISEYSELLMVKSYIDFLAVGSNMEKDIGHILGSFPIWTEFLADVRGIGPKMGGVIVSEFDITQAKYVSSLWKYAGLDVAGDGTARSRREEHLIKVKYINKKGEEAEKNSITYNKFLHDKLLGVLAESFIKTKSEYTEAYYGYKNRLANHPVHKEKQLGHRDNMAKRYMVKEFVKDLYARWRSIEGLPVHEPYSAAKLGLKHGQDI